MLAGTLDTQITIEAQVTTQDSQFGTDVVTWRPIGGRIWAEVKDMLPSRSEAVRQGLSVATNQTRIRIRYRSGIDSSMRVIVHRDGDVLHQIVGGPAEIGRREALEFVCERYSSQGAA